MKKLIYLTALVMVSLLVMGVSALPCNQCYDKNTNNQKICETTYQIRSPNTINNQMPKFECCACLAACPGCPCVGDYCKKGDQLKKHVKLTDLSCTGAASCNLDAEADITVYNYNGLDNTKVVLRVNHLFPRNAVFTASLVDTAVGGETLKIGEFRTNYMGRGYVYFQQNVNDFNKFDKLVVTDSMGITVAEADLTFKCTSPLTVQTQTL
jgi:hypothetical protein